MAKPTILVVDDEPLNLTLLSRLLKPQYRVLGARSGAAALSLVDSERPELILLDVMMPEMDGYEVLAELRRNSIGAEIPVIFVTALGSETDEEKGLALGAVDYIVKPIKPAVVMARVRTHLELKTARDSLAGQNQWLELELGRRLAEIQLAQELTLTAMAEMAETRDRETGHHILRTQAYVEALARQLQKVPGYAEELDEAQLQRIVKAAPMHDIGKIGIPDAILLKPGRLTPAEWELMKTHAQIGGNAIGVAVEKALALHPVATGAPLPEAIRFLRVAQQIATHHHERWDGTGYPGELAAEAIPLAARLMALADVFDALTTPRVYKKPWTFTDTIAHIEAGSGLHFDPQVVAAMKRCMPQFKDIARRLADPESVTAPKGEQLP